MECLTEEVSRIKKILKDHPEGMNIKTIAAQLGINRNTVAKHLDSLKLLGEVEVRQSGISKVFSLCRRYPITPLMELIREPFVALDQNLTIIEINDPLLAVIGQERVKMCGRGIRETEFGKILDRKAYTIIKKWTNGEAQQGESVFTVTLRERNFHVSSIPVVFENRAHGVGLILRQSPDFPAESEISSKSHPVFVDMKDMMALLDPEMTILFANNRYCRNIGKRKKEIIGEEFSPRAPHQDMMHIRASIRALSPENVKAECEFREIMPDGSFQWQSWTYRALFTNDGRLTGYQATGQDITEKKRLEEKLKVLEQQLENIIHRRTAEFREINQQLYQEIQNLERMKKQALMLQSTIDHANDPVVWVNMSDRIIYANENTVQLLGYTREELLSLQIQDIIPDYQSKQYGRLGTQLEKKASVITDAFMQTRAGTRIPVELSISHQKYRSEEYYSIVLRDITRWNILEENRKRLAAIIEANPYLVAIADPDLGLVYLNAAGRTFLSIGMEEELKGLKLVDFFPPLARDYLLEKGLPGAMLQGRWRGDAVITPRTGDIIPVEVILIAHRSEEGVATHVSMIALDISERKKAENILRESKNKYMAVFKASIDGVLLITPKGEINDCNAAACRIFGYPEEELTTLSGYDLVSEEARPLLKGIFTKESVLERQIHELPGRRKNGMIFPFAMSSRLVTIKGDQTLVFYIHEIIDRKREELALMAAALYARDLIEANLDPLFIIDRDGTITDVNRAAEDLTGITRGQLMGSSFCRWMSDPDNARFVIEDILSSGSARDVPVVFRNISGEVIQTLVSTRIYRNEKGDMQENFLVARRVNEQDVFHARMLTLCPK